jgi:hypothetical protein
VAAEAGLLDCWKRSICVTRVQHSSSCRFYAIASDRGFDARGTLTHFLRLFNPSRDIITQLFFVDCNSGFRWLYGMKTKDEMLKVMKEWYSDIADLRQKHQLVVIVRDNAGENKSHEIIDFIE